MLHYKTHSEAKVLNRQWPQSQNLKHTALSCLRNDIHNENTSLLHPLFGHVVSSAYLATMTFTLCLQSWIQPDTILSLGLVQYS